MHRKLRRKRYSVRGVGTFCDTCSNLGQLFPYNLKTCTVIPPKFKSQNFRPSIIGSAFLMYVLVSAWNFCFKFSWIVRTWNNDFKNYFIFQWYSTSSKFSTKFSSSTVPMIWRKSRKMQLLAFDEYSTFDTSFVFGHRNRGSVYIPK